MFHFLAKQYDEEYDMQARITSTYDFIISTIQSNGYMSQKKILTSQIDNKIKLLCEDADTNRTVAFAEGLKSLHDDKVHITSKMLRTMLDNVDHMSKITRGLYYLQISQLHSNVKLIDKLVAHAPHADKLGRSFAMLENLEIKLTEAVTTQLCLNAENAVEQAKEIIKNESVREQEGKSEQKIRKAIHQHFNSVDPVQEAVVVRDEIVHTLEQAIIIAKDELSKQQARYFF